MHFNFFSAPKQQTSILGIILVVVLSLILISLIALCIHYQWCNPIRAKFTKICQNCDYRKKESMSKNPSEQENAEQSELLPSVNVVSETETSVSTTSTTDTTPPKSNLINVEAQTKSTNETKTEGETVTSCDKANPSVPTASEKIHSERK